MTYSNKDKLILMFGLTQVIKWSDIDGERQDTPNMDARITEALQDTDDYINERLADNGYTVPFTSVPRRIVSLATLGTGVYLYDNRISKDGGNSQRDEVSRPRKKFDQTIRQLLNGQLKLIHPTSGEIIEKSSATHPVLIKESCAKSCCLDPYCGVCGCFTCICSSNVWS